MKKIVLSLLVLTAGQVSFAAVCSDASSLIADAQATYEKVQKLAAVSAASEYEVLLTQKHLLDLKLCANENDARSYADLVGNTVRRLKIAISFNSSGLLTESDMTLVNSEVQALNLSCPALLKSAEAKQAVGMRSAADVVLLQSACEELTNALK